MPLAPGTRLGPYEVVAPVGAGGMGEVYRARDTSLDRDVAIKILPEFLAADPERVARFSREAKTLASLNHANIAHVHGVVEIPRAGTAALLGLVMEFVEGEDLAQRLASGPLPLDEAIPIARQIADALECAHEQGIVHRDLKPANVKVRPDGAVKVLDFGLAKAFGAPESNASSSALLLSPTFTSPAMTQMGIILGTAAYMAPEQARGKIVDKRADVWAFGVLLFEMLSGTRAFEGSEVSDTLAFVLTREPDWRALPADTPAPIRRLLKRCLHKDRKQRLADISDARLELDEALVPSGSEPAAAPAPRLGRTGLAAIAAALVAAAALGGFASLTLLTPEPPPPVVARFSIELPEGVEFTNTGRHFIALSPDATRIVYVAASQLYMRPLSNATAQPIPGTALGSPVINPVFSPDGQSLAYYSDRALRRIPVTGGTPFTLAEISNPYGMFWGDAGLFVSQGAGGIVRVPEAGGRPEVVVKAEAGETLQGPQLLADGETMIFTVITGSGGSRLDRAKIVAQSLRTGTRKVLHEGGVDAQVVPTGHLVFGGGGVLYALKFDARTVSVSGPPVPVVEGVRRSPVTGAMQYRVAANGTLIYVTGSAMASNTALTVGWLDRAGKATPLPVAGATYDAPRLSPKGDRFAVGIEDDQDGDIWIQDLPVKAAIRRLTFGGRNRYPAWSPDGKRLAFQSNRRGAGSIYVQDADISGPNAELLVEAERDVMLIPESWSPDGQWLAVTVITGDDMQLAMFSFAERKLVPHAAEPRLRFRSPVFSPDGRWIAYHTVSDAGTPTAFIEPFPATGARYQIGEAVHPLWIPPAGRELLVSPRLPTLSLYQVSTTPTVAFALAQSIPRSGSLGGAPGSIRPHDVTRDGRQFLVLLPSANTTGPARAIEVVLNWFEELKK